MAVMFADYGAWLAGGADLPFSERVSRCVVVPELFSDADKRALRDEMSSRGLVYDGSGSTSCDRADAWAQLKEGVVLISCQMMFSTRSGRLRHVTVTRTPFGPETWVLSGSRCLPVRGEGRESMLAALDARAATRRRS